MRRIGLLSGTVIAACLMGMAGLGEEWTEAVFEPAPAANQAKLEAELGDLPPVPPGMTNIEDYVALLAPRVLAAEEGSSTGAPVRTTRVDGDGMGYVQVAEVVEAMPSSLVTALANLGRTNRLRGLVLDLRFANGNDFGAAAAAAGVLAQESRDDFQLGTDPWPIVARTNALRLPLMILVNRQTRGAAEALAAALRVVVQPSLVIGTNTAGAGRTYREVSVGEGWRVRVADRALKLPGGREFPWEGLTPDLLVAISERDERAYLEDPFHRVVEGRRIRNNGTIRVNEAELLRRRFNGDREAPPFTDPHGVEPGGEDGGGDDEGRAGTWNNVQDPVLGRALDLLEALAGKQGTELNSEADSR